MPSSAAGTAEAGPTVVVVMGVAGCGKSTVGALLAARLGCPFYEGDAYHPPANVAKMRAGVPLSDDDRWPWLRELAAHVVARHVASGEPAVLSCSALKPAYRQLLAGGQQALNNLQGSSSGGGGCDGGGNGAPGAAGGSSGSGGGGVAFVLLEPPRAVLEARLQARSASGDHFMPASLLDSQLATLQYEEGELYMHVAGAAAAAPALAVAEAVLARMGRATGQQQQRQVADETLQ